MQVQPYLWFEGRCEAAIEFYQSALGAEVPALMRYKEMRDLDEHTMVPPGGEDAIIYARLHIGDTVVLVSDGRCSGQTNFQGFALSLTAPDNAETERRFAALADGGQVQMPLMPTAFSPLFGMVVDRFGVNWIVLTTA